MFRPTKIRPNLKIYDRQLIMYKNCTCKWARCIFAIGKLPTQQKIVTIRLLTKSQQPDFLDQHFYGCADRMSTDKISNRQNVEQTKCRTDKMSNRQNVERQNAEKIKCR